MENKQQSSSLFTTLLLITFIVLKLCHVIDWSWWWVLSPIWIHIAILLIVGVIFIGVVYIKENTKRAKRIKELMETGRSEVGATIEYLREKESQKIIPKRSKFQEKLHQMEEERRSKNV